MSTRRNKTRFQRILREYYKNVWTKTRDRVLIRYIRLNLRRCVRPPKYDTQEERYMKHMERQHQSWLSTGRIFKYSQEHPNAFRRLAGDAKD